MGSAMLVRRDGGSSVFSGRALGLGSVIKSVSLSLYPHRCGFRKARSALGIIQTTKTGSSVCFEGLAASRQITFKQTHPLALLSRFFNALARGYAYEWATQAQINKQTSAPIISLVLPWGRATAAIPCEL
jgi:hypothetical protein